MTKQRNLRPEPRPVYWAFFSKRRATKAVYTRKEIKLYVTTKADGSMYRCNDRPLAAISLGVPVRISLTYPTSFSLPILVSGGRF